MSSTTTVTLELPTHALSDQRNPLQRSMIRHLLYEGRITMQEALDLLSPEDQGWLVKRLICDAQDNLVIANRITDPELQARYWQQYNNLLGHLFHWHEHWTPYHSELLTVLRTVIRRYPVQDLTPERAKLMGELTARLHADRLYREDVFAAEQALQDVGWDTVLDLSPIADSLMRSYLDDLGRA